MRLTLFAPQPIVTLKAGSGVQPWEWWEFGMVGRIYNVAAAWDEEGSMWYVAESDVPGLNTEAKSFEELIERVTAIAPELLELNGLEPEGKGDIPVRVTAARDAVAVRH